MIRRVAAIVLVALALVSHAARAQVAPAAAADRAMPAVQVRASVDRTAIWVGDRVIYLVDIVCRPGVEILLDDVAKEKLRVSGLDIVGSDETTTTDASDRTTYRLRYVLATYRLDAASLSIEPLSVRYYERRPGQRLQDVAPAGEAAIPGATVAFRSTLPDQPTYALRDGRAPAARPWFAARGGSIGLGLAVVSLAPAAFLAAALLGRRTRTAGRRSARRTRMDQRTTLEQLRALDVSTADDRRRAYDEISAVVRQHLAEAAGVPGPSLTAAEIDAALARSGSRLPREAVVTLLAACDNARYGPVQALPSAEACRDGLAAAGQLLAGR